MKKAHNLLIGFVCLLMLFCVSCKKQLDLKPASNVVVPSTLKDFQAILDQEIYMLDCPAMGELSSDDYYLTDSYWQARSEKERNCYVWAKDIYDGIGGVEDWNFPYRQIFYTNVVLDALPDVKKDVFNSQDWNNIKADALFKRAYAHYNLVQVFALPYDSATANVDLGIPLRLTADVNLPTKRGTIKETYDQIIADLNEAKTLFAVGMATDNRNRGSKSAAFALLARVYLSMRKYEQALVNADSCLQIYNTLMDYNSLSTTATFPFPKANEEVLYSSRLLSSTITLRRAQSGCIIDSTLYQSYSANDLRKILFFRINATTSLPNIKAGYLGSSYPFSGLATDEVYLIRSECSARAGNLIKCMDDLNTLLRLRWRSGTFTEISASSAQDALNKVLTERRKELIWRGLRWSDIRRFNKEGWILTLTRNLNGQLYTLPANDPRYALPIPDDEIALSGIEQNPR